MQIARTLDVLRTQVDLLRDAPEKAGASIGFVPTMGALHEGHPSLIRHARARCDYVVASVFVNPAQFGPNEDLAAYPRQLEADAALLEAEGCALLWAPDVAEMYPEGFATNICIKGASEGLCGTARPGHFDGVAPTLTMLEDDVLGAGFDGVDYAVLADAGSLKPLDALHDQPARLLVAARIGGTRLIDNMALAQR